MYFLPFSHLYKKFCFIVVMFGIFFYSYFLIILIDLFYLAQIKHLLYFIQFMVVYVI